MRYVGVALVLIVMFGTILYTILFGSSQPCSRLATRASVDFFFMFNPRLDGDNDGIPCEHLHTP